MTINEAIKILDPETSKEALRPYAYDNYQRRKVVDKACRIAAEELRKRQWISVKDRLPETESRVLVSDGFDIDTGYYRLQKGTWHCDDSISCDCLDEITYWQQLPDLPSDSMQSPEPPQTESCNI